ncbi:DUF6197 family protein [Pseudonocardia acaciae]|uniref:DUF6197 family protein n=1 Tax=Pseudonocardia acaciae TaxID=551276 RepID=UPI0004913627|nr:hypothetical protein [Pseudonocardia acaciae]
MNTIVTDNPAEQPSLRSRVASAAFVLTGVPLVRAVVGRARARRERADAELDRWVASVLEADRRYREATHDYEAGLDEIYARAGRARPAPDVVAASVLARAAGLIESDGWLKGKYWPGGDAHGPYAAGAPCCAVGGLAVAAGVHDPKAVMPAMVDRPALVEAVRALYRVIASDPDPADDDAPYELTRAVEWWNDHDGREAVEVVAALRRAADMLTPGFGGSSAKTSHQAGSPNHQNGSKESDV